MQITDATETRASDSTNLGVLIAHARNTDHDGDDLVTVIAAGMLLLAGKLQHLANVLAAIEERIGR